MDEYETQEDIKKAYVADELFYLDAIEALVNKFGFQPKEAEALVCDVWDKIHID
jgi:hypothetical protein